MNYFELDKYIKLTYRNTEYNNYDKLGGVLSQQILRLLDKNWKSFFKSLEDWKKNSNKYMGIPKTPKYRSKNSCNLLIYPTVKIDKNSLLSLSKNVKLKVPTGLNFDYNKIKLIKSELFLN